MEKRRSIKKIRRIDDIEMIKKSLRKNIVEVGVERGNIGVGVET